MFNGKLCWYYITNGDIIENKPRSLLKEDKRTIKSHCRREVIGNINEVD